MCVCFYREYCAEESSIHARTAGRRVPLRCEDEAGKLDYFSSTEHCRLRGRLRCHRHCAAGWFLVQISLLSPTLYDPPQNPCHIHPYIHSLTHTHTRTNPICFPIVRNRWSLVDLTRTTPIPRAHPHANRIACNRYPPIANEPNRDVRAPTRTIILRWTH